MNKIYAHKDSCFKYPENSRDAILDAYQDPYNDGIELNVWVSKDNVPVIHHDNNVILNSNIFKKVIDMTLAELQEIACTMHLAGYPRLSIMLLRKEILNMVLNLTKC